MFESGMFCETLALRASNVKFIYKLLGREAAMRGQELMSGRCSYSSEISITLAQRG